MRVRLDARERECVSPLGKERKVTEVKKRKKGETDGIEKQKNVEKNEFLKCKSS